MTTTTTSQPGQAGPRPAATPLAHGLPLGRYGGVTVTAHWSTLGIAALLIAVLGADVLPAWQPRHAPTAYWTVAVLAAIGFLVTLLAHEIAHAAAARRYRLPVRQITLWLLGGVTDLDGVAPTPRAEAAIAAAGPVTSLALGGALFGLARLTGPGLAGVALAWVAAANLLLGAFNLLPGAPLDGGRLLRAGLWAGWHDRRRAVRAAAGSGRVLGYAVLGLGVVEIFAGNPASGAWLLFVGWLLAGAAAAEPDADLAYLLRGRTVRDLMTAPPTTAPCWWTVTDFLARLGPAPRPDDGYVLVDLDGHPTGALTVATARQVHADERDSTRLREVIGRVDPLVVAADAPIDGLVRPLRAHAGIAVVVDGAELVATLRLAALESAARSQT